MWSNRARDILDWQAHHSDRFPPSKSRRQAIKKIESGFAADKLRKEKRGVELFAILVALLASMLTSFALAKLALLGVFSLISVNGRED
jgi:hypothetical protein